MVAMVRITALATLRIFNHSLRIRFPLLAVVGLLATGLHIVGLRTERPEFVDKVRKEIANCRERRCFIPAITGWAQLHYPFVSITRDSTYGLEHDPDSGGTTAWVSMRRSGSGQLALFRSVSEPADAMPCTD